MNMNYKLIPIIFISLILLTVVVARVEIIRPGAGGGSVSIITFTGNLTNVSEMEDVNVPSPNEGEVFTWNDTTGVWESLPAGTAANDSMNNYVVNYTGEINASVNNYITENNNSINNYIVNYTGEINASVNNYILWVNSTNFQVDTDTWVANFSSYYTSTEVDTEISDNNDSVNNYILYVNGTAADYTDSKLITTFFNATNVNPVTGTPAGTVADLQDKNDISYNVTEVGSDFELIINFTSIDIFNQVIYRYKSAATESHMVSVQIWEYSTLSWENFDHLGNTENDYIIRTATIYDYQNHVSDGVVQVRFYSNNVGGATHLHQFDWVSISSGPATPSGEETDPHAIHSDGMISFIANWDQGAFNLTNTDSWFLGNVAGLTENNNSVNNYILAVNNSMNNYITENNASIVNTMVPYTGADKDIDIGTNNFTIGGGVIWWNGTMMIFN